LTDVRIVDSELSGAILSESSGSAWSCGTAGCRTGPFHSLASGHVSVFDSKLDAPTSDSPRRSDRVEGCAMPDADF